jgi:tetratricopeptide (TPR) repeat protein
MRAPSAFQRIEKTDIASYNELVADHRAQLNAVPRRSPRKRAKLLSKLGVLLLADSGAVDEAYELLESAQTIADQVGYDRLIATNGIRLAMALQQRGDHSAALRKLDWVIEFIVQKRLRKLKDFALQHKGKCLAELGAKGAAEGCFKSALRLRKNRRDDELIASTARALRALSCE